MKQQLRRATWDDFTLSMVSPITVYFRDGSVGLIQLPGGARAHFRMRAIGSYATVQAAEDAIRTAVHQRRYKVMR